MTDMLRLPAEQTYAAELAALAGAIRAAAARLGDVAARRRDLSDGRQGRGRTAISAKYVGDKG